MSRCLQIALILNFAASVAFGASEADQVVVVYNAKVPDSKRVALHYAERRGVPPDQVLGLDLPKDEIISRRAFRNDLQRPLFDWLVKRKLWAVNEERRPKQLPPAFQPVIDSRIRYVVLCYGVPLKIARDVDLKEEGMERLREELRRNEAAVDTELALLPGSREKVLLAGPAANGFIGTTNASVLQPTNGILMVTRLDGPTFEIANSLVDKALLAESNGFWGRAYFDARGLTNNEYLMGDDWMRISAQITRRLGFETTLDDAAPTFAAAFPMSHIALYAGWYDGAVSGPFARPEVEFMPGAFAYHLHSFSASTIRSTTAHWVGPLLAKGATITFGCVEEPYLSGTPNIAIFVERLLHGRFNFAEAAYAAQPVLSWQTTIIGDPLYRPFGERPDLLHYRLEQSTNAMVEWSHLRVVNLNQATGLPVAELLKYLGEIPLSRDSAVLQEKIGDLYRLEGRLSAACDAYSRAVRLKPSPQQRIRLLLAIGEWQTLLAREQEAYDAFQQLIRDAPEYPNLAQIHHRLVGLARSLGRAEEADKHQKEFERLTAPTP